MQRSKKYHAILFLVALTSLGCIEAADKDIPPPRVGVVNFKTCLEKSKLGIEEQTRFENLKKEMEATIDAKEKELNAMAPKFSEEYLDTLTPEAEQKLREDFKNLSQDLSQLQNQYYHLLNQTNFQIMQRLQEAIAKASKSIAQTKKIDIMVNEEAVFYYADTFDCSDAVVMEMNQDFAKAKKTAVEGMEKK